MPKKDVNLHKDEIGIDLSKYYKEVHKIVRAYVFSFCAASVSDSEDIIQEVFTGILIRNRGTCPYQYGKSSWSHYIIMVTKCVISNYVARQKRRESVIDVGVIENGAPIDAGSSEQHSAMTCLQPEHAPDVDTILLRAANRAGCSAALQADFSRFRVAADLITRGYALSEVEHGVFSVFRKKAAS
jgi:DNA-directed RNA polymerase specialized sigma24 family protein